MKRNSLLIALLGLVSFANLSFGQLAVGAVTKDVPFTLFDGSGDLINTSLSEFEGKILLVFYYTPW